MFDIITAGFGHYDWALTTNRVIVGTFFAISGYHKLFNKRRHESLRTTLIADGIPYVGLFEWLVPAFELAAGTAVAVGFLAPLAAVALMVICMVACFTDGVKRVREYQPIDLADAIDDWLYLPEVLYMVSLTFVIVSGPGPLRLDALF